MNITNADKVWSIEKVYKRKLQGYNSSKARGHEIEKEETDV